VGASAGEIAVLLSRDFVFQTDFAWWIFAAASVCVLGIAGVTVSRRVYKSVSKNPVEALRYE
jgi:hypothetical protein